MSICTPPARRGHGTQKERKKTLYLMMVVVARGPAMVLLWGGGL